MSIEDWYFDYLKRELNTDNIKINYQFHLNIVQESTGKKREWKMDIALLDWKINIEFEGGVWSKGGHVRGKIYTDNCDKYTQATCLGWFVLRYTTEQAQNFINVLNDIRRCIILYHDRKNIQ